MADGQRAGECSGAHNCVAVEHVHGCYADYGACDSPEEHRRPFTPIELFHLSHPDGWRRRD